MGIKQLSKQLLRKVSDFILAWVGEADSLYISRFTSLNNAIETIGLARKTLYINFPTKMTSDIAVPPNISIIIEYPGIIDLNSHNLTINGPFSAGLYHVFEGAEPVKSLKCVGPVMNPVIFGKGAIDFERRVIDYVTFGKGVVDFVRPEWFGAKSDAGFDNNTALAPVNTTAFLRAEASAYASRAPLKLSAGTYCVTSTPGSYAITSRVGIEGESPNTSIIKNVGTGSALKLENGPGSENGYYQRMKNFSVEGVRGTDGKTPPSEDGIVLNPTGCIWKAWAYSTFSSVDSNHHGRNGLVHRASWGTKYHDCKFYENGGLGVWLKSAGSDRGFHNAIGFTNCEFSSNGGMDNNDKDWKGGVRVDWGATTVYFKGGIVESNNAWGMILGKGFEGDEADFFVDEFKESVDEFKKGYTIGALCAVLKSAGIVVGSNTVAELNKILEQVGLYANLTKLYYDKAPSNDLKMLKTVYDTSETIDCLKILNRSLLEEFYPKETPKSFKRKVTDLTVENIHFENNPNRDPKREGSAIGGNVHVSGRYEGIEISKCYGDYGAKAGATGYGFYVANNTIGNSYFKEYGNVLYDFGDGTNIRDYGLQYDWTASYKSKLFNGQEPAVTILRVSPTGTWIIKGFITCMNNTASTLGLYPFVAARAGGELKVKMGWSLVGEPPIPLKVEWIEQDKSRYYLTVIMEKDHYGSVELDLGGTSFDPPTVFQFPGEVWMYDFVKRSKLQFYKPLFAQERCCYPDPSKFGEVPKPQFGPPPK